MDRYAKLRGLIREKYRTQEAFAEAIGLHPATLSGKLRGVTDWTRSEIELTVNTLGIPAEEVAAYFFS